MSTPTSREKLEFESPEDRQARLAPTSPSNTIPAPPTRPFAMPESSVLARVRDFLPMMANSNTELLKKMEENPEDVDIENTDGDEQVIAMDVNLGVFDVNGQPKGDLGPEIDLPEDTKEMAEDDEDDDDEMTSESSAGSDSSDSEAETKEHTERL